jgi:hypothetical protein
MKDEALKRIAASGILPGQRYRHYGTGDVYLVIAVGLFEVDLEPLVHYRSADDEYAIIWTRPLDVFGGQVPSGGALVQRFERVECVRRFPVLVGQSRVPYAVRDRWPRSVPWAFAETFREQAEDNHGQTLERLAERGGLAPEEMWLAAHGQGLSKFRWTVPVPNEEACGEWLISEMQKLKEIS